MGSLYVANFGARGELNGQVQKTLQVEALLADLDPALERLDVSRNPFWFKRLLLADRGFSKIFVSLGRNGIRVALLALFVRQVLLRSTTPVWCIAVGGWLVDLLSRSWLLRVGSCVVDVYLVESAALRDQLERRGYRAAVLPNFRPFPAEPEKPLVERGALRLCFCSRVTREKGVLEAVELTRALSAAGIDASLDVHGPVEPEFRLEFQAAIEHLEAVRYMGPYDGEKAVQLLRRYDFLVFPTRYPGECMPGVVVEAFCAGTSVITSDWRYMSEYVEHGVNGYVCPLEHFSETAVACLVSLLADDGYLHLSRAAVETYAERFSEGKARAILERLDRRSVDDG